MAALLAYGNVKQIRRSVEDALARIQTVAGSPAEFVRKVRDPAFYPQAQKAFRGFVHRFNLGCDLVLLFQLLSQSWEKHGSLGSHFVSHLDPKAQNIGIALEKLIAEWRTWEKDQLGFSRRNDTFSYLLTSPKDGSCCKRWCMFLRWVGRHDDIDVGLWTETGALQSTMRGRYLRPDQLVIPLDTHTGRISQYLSLTSRKTLGWLAAVEVTEALKKCAPDDPVRYDFSISRLGILDLCQKAFRVEICLKCDLLKVCKFAKAGLKK